MRYLIDGYNLAHAAGILTARLRAAHQLEQARATLLLRLRQGHGAAVAAVTVVFDSGGPRRPRAPAEQDHQGVRVIFAAASADDLIEELIDKDRGPHELTVVSDDRRLRAAAKRRGCVALGCLDYLEQLAHPPAERAEPPPEPAKPTAGLEDQEQWLAAFGEIDSDPSLGEDLERRFREGEGRDD
jgi:predicted RNA-binding protein with PIN domain